jgi:hypothetical protein
MWGDRRARLVDCIAQKNCAMHNDKWEKQFTEFERCVAMSGRVIRYSATVSVGHRKRWFGN